jgi:hypothetical protein
VFVSSAAVVNPIGGVETADAKCQALADAQSLGGNWKAWISQPSAPVSTRFTHAVVPYSLLDGTIIANDWNDLTDLNIAHPINIDETGATAPGGMQIWTGTDAFGASHYGSACRDWTNATSSVHAVMGVDDATDRTWTEMGVPNEQTCDQTTLHLYCFEQGSGPNAPGPGPTTCPSSFDFTSPVPTVVRGGSGGVPRARFCPAGQVPVGFSVYEAKMPAPDVVSGLVEICGTLSVVQATCEVTILPGTTLPMSGGTGDQPVANRNCPPDQMVVAVGGRAGNYVDQISFGCAPLLLSKVGATYQASVGPITWLAPVGGTGGSAFTNICPAGQVAIGSDVHSGIILDAFALFCATPVLLP